VPKGWPPAPELAGTGAARMTLPAIARATPSRRPTPTEDELTVRDRLVRGSVVLDDHHARRGDHLDLDPRRGLHLGEREAEPERRAVSGIRVQPQPPVHGLDELLGDVQPEPG